MSFSSKEVETVVLAPSMPASIRSDSEHVDSKHPSNLQTNMETVGKDEGTHLSGFSLLATMTAIVLVGFLMMLDTSIIATAIPKITTDLHSLNDVGWYGTAYLLSNCAVQPLSGKIYTHFNSKVPSEIASTFRDLGKLTVLKWALLSFFAVFEVGSAVCGAATSSNMLIIGRAIAGLGASGLMNGGYTIIHSIVVPEKHPLYLGILIGIIQLGVLGGPLIGGVLTQYATWRWCFYINLPIGALVFVLLFLVKVPDHTIKGAEKQTHLQILAKLDLIGFVLFAPAAIQFLLALQWGGVKYSWGSATIIGLFCGSFGTLLVFLAWEYHKKDDAMIPFSIMRKRIILMSCLNNGFFFGSMLLSTYYLPIYFQAVRNATPTMSGVDMLPTVISTIIVGIAGGAIVGRIGYYLPPAVASGVLNTLGTGLVSTFTPTTAVGVWIGYQIIQGTARGLGFQMPILAVQNNSPLHQIATASAMAVFFQTLGGAIGLSLGQVLFSNRLRDNLAHYAPEVNAATVIEAGATGIRTVVPAASFPMVLLAYNNSLRTVFYLGTGIAGGQLLFSFGMGWINTKKNKLGGNRLEAEKD